MSPAPALVVLAAGIGSRYGGLKQLAEVSEAGHTLMDFAVFDALRAGFQRVVLIVSAGSEEAVRAHVEAGCGRHVEVHFARQESGDRPKPWGTGHAVLTARPCVEGAFGVVNADDYYGRQSFAILGEALAEPGDHHVLVGYTLRETLSDYGGVSRGLCLLDGDKLRAVVELHEVRATEEGITSADPEWGHLSGDEVISTNLWGFRPTFFDVLDEEFQAFGEQHGSDEKAEFYIGSAVNSLIERGQAGVKVLRTSDRFFGMTFQDDLAGVREQLARRIAAGDYPERLWE
ncbi:MAG: sugar phosphate nucleotidyltransferase [Actinomycetota bacterium]|nr:sugar phosphate nucleotidyltransferase [Actinomycetota bacterium]